MDGFVDISLAEEWGEEDGIVIYFCTIVYCIPGNLIIFGDFSGYSRMVNYFFKNFRDPKLFFLQIPDTPNSAHVSLHYYFKST